MPNFVKMDSKPFHPETYVGPEHDDEDVQAETSVREKSMSIKLKVENTVRWKWTKDAQGNDVRPLPTQLLLQVLTTICRRGNRIVGLSGGLTDR